jgi:membrane protein DedA with SNARE-associated domain
VETLSSLAAQHGYWLVATIVALESMGIPLPGETTLVSAAIYAGTTHELNIWMLIAATATGAIVGDNIGFWIGREYGYSVILRYGHLVRLNPRRIKLGQFLFDRHGGKVVFFGRFVALLRVLAALLAGINCMEWRRFLLFNALGGLVWSTVFGLAGFLFGRQLEEVKGPLAIASMALAAVAFLAGVWFIRRHESSLYEQADRGPRY